MLLYSEHCLADWKTLDDVAQWAEYNNLYYKRTANKIIVQKQNTTYVVQEISPEKHRLQTIRQQVIKTIEEYLSHPNSWDHDVKSVRAVVHEYIVSTIANNPEIKKIERELGTDANDLINAYYDSIKLDLKIGDLSKEEKLSVSLEHFYVRPVNYIEPQ